MELDDLKNSWNNIGKEQLQTSKEIINLKELHSKSPIVKIRKNMLREAFIFIVFLICFAVIILQKNYANQDLGLWISALFILLSIPSFIFFARVYNNTQQHDPSAHSLAGYLDSTITKLEKDLAFYRGINYLFIIPSIIVGSILGNHSISELADVLHPSRGVMLSTLLTVLILTIPTLFAVNYYIKKVYSNYIDELKKMYKEIKE